jgi:hypothetical protein
MAWIESHQELRNHPKVSAVCRTLSAEKNAIIGSLHCLWWWCMDYAMDGDISRYNAQQIADAAEWKGDATKFAKALLDAGLIDRGKDGSTSVHDWFDFCGDLIHKRLRRKEEKRQKSADIVRRNPPKVRLPDPTQPDPTRPNVSCAEPGKAPALAPAVHPWLIGIESYAGDSILQKRIWSVDKSWMKAFPGVAIEEEVRKAAAWELANPKRKKVDRIRFLHNWLSRAQDRGGSHGTGQRYSRPSNQHVTTEPGKYAGIAKPA